MKFVIVLALVALAVARPDDGQYDSKYDNIDADELANNPRLLKAYGNCIAGLGPCTQEAADVNEKIPEGIQTSCAKCTVKQRVVVAKFVKGLKSQFPDLYEKMYNKFDPDHKRTSEFEEFIAKNS